MRTEQRDDRASSRRRLCASTAALLLIATTSGCRNLFESDEYLSYRVPPEELSRIDPLVLDDYDVGEPEKLDTAAREVLERIVDPGVPTDSRDITIEEVRAAVLQQNLDLRVELINPSIAATQVDEEEARFEATFSASARIARQDTPTALATEGNNVDIDSYRLGLEIPLRTGGTADVSLPINRTETDNVFALLNPAYDSDLRFSISQPLLRNAGPRTNLHPIRVARGQEQITGARTKLEAIRILANADRAYWRLYGARRQLEVRLQEYQLAIEQLETAERRVDAGDAPGIEVTRARSGVAETLQSIIVAENEVRQRQRELKRIMNMANLPINSGTVILPATEPNPLWREFEPDVIAAYAVVNRMEMLELELQLAIDASTVDFERNQALPLFVVDYTYNLGGIGRTYNNAFDRIADRSFEDHTFGLSAEVPIGNDVARSRVHRAILTRLQRLATRDQRELAIRQEVYDTLDALEEAWQRILAARLESRLAGETYEAERRQFDVGLRTSTDVLDASTRLANAQASEVRALADYEIAQVDLAFATGTLLGAQRVRWEAIDIDKDELGYFGQGAVTTPPAITDPQGAPAATEVPEAPAPDDAGS